jgi:Ni/Fe-hydrogenase b-type cytochrome subunit
MAVVDQKARLAPQPGRRKPTQPVPVRILHWLNALALVLMAGSGLQILYAYPKFGPQGDLSGWYPFQGDEPPSWIRLGDGLAAARHIHFAVAWLLVLNAIAYSIWLLVSGEWKKRLFSPRRDMREVFRSISAYMHLREAPVTVGPYNGLQRLGYTSALFLGLVSIVSGIALYKPVQLHWMGFVFGGYDGARAIHFLSLVSLIGFTIGHVIMVALHPRELVLMTAGGTRKEKA